jgi:hypothetical protein
VPNKGSGLTKVTVRDFLWYKFQLLWHTFCVPYVRQTLYFPLLEAPLGYCAAFTDDSGQPIGPTVKGMQCPRSQKSKDLIYTTAATWNYLYLYFFFRSVICAQLGTIDKLTFLSGEKPLPITHKLTAIESH